MSDPADRELLVRWTRAADAPVEVRAAVSRLAAREPERVRALMRRRDAAIELVLAPSGSSLWIADHLVARIPEGDPE